MQPRVTARIAAETGLLAEPGKLAAELRPPINADKGSALIALVATGKLTMVAYAGDDLGDIACTACCAKQAQAGWPGGDD